MLDGLYPELGVGAAAFFPADELPGPAAYRPDRMKSAIFSPTMMVGMLVLAQGTVGMIEASQTRRPATP